MVYQVRVVNVYFANRVSILRKTDGQGIFFWAAVFGALLKGSARGRNGVVPDKESSEPKYENLACVFIT